MDSDLVPIKTWKSPTSPDKDYDHERKERDPVKRSFNVRVCQFVKNLATYWAGINLDKPVSVPMKTIVLDGLYLGTSRRLVADCKIPWTSIDIVSAGVCFESKEDTGILYTGKLSDFLLEHRGTVYDVAVFDFCGTWPGVDNEQRKCIKYLFKYHMIEDVGILVATFSPRKKCDRLHERYQMAEDGIYELAKRYGYRAYLHDSIRSNTCSTYYKIVHPVNVMAADGGIKQSKKTGDYATDWSKKGTV